ncbi:Sec63 [Serendipita sp. 400]|nr:Sec63 [Serendipita sp. 400]
MKMRAKSRFILVSATVPNASDIATWIGPRDGGESAICLKFGNEYRPCKLTQHVQGYRRNNASSFQFDRTLDGKVFGALQKYCDAKPTLIFCATRKGAVATAQRIVKDYKEMQTKHAVLPWKPIKQEWPKMHSDLAELVSFGVAIHHAGLSPEDRRLIEDRFLTGKLFIVVATSTLAVGVNLPCRTVIIKGVELWDGSKTREYSDLDVLQMMGRAGRPQFDKEGVAVILCDLEQRQKYEKLTQASTVIESSLHLSLAEHLNSEIVLGTVGDVKSGREWIKNTFFYRRIQVNPVYYGFLSGIPAGGWEAYFDNLVEQTLANLTSSQMIEYKEGLVNATAFGNLASRLYVKRPSMKLIIEIPELATKKDVLLALSQADEYKEVRLRQGERSVYNKLCQHSDIRFGLKKVERAHEKVYILLQAILGNISLGATEYQNRDSILPLEATRVYKHAIRLMSCVIEAAVSRGAGSLLKTSLELYRSLKAKGWEDRPTVLRQLEGIGEKAMQAWLEFISRDFLSSH